MAVVSSTSAMGSNSVTITTSAINTTGAKLIVVAIAWDDSILDATLSDSLSNSWTALTIRRHPTVGECLQLLYKINPTVGSSHTFTASAANDVYPGISVIAFDDVVTFDQESGDTRTQPGPQTVQPGSLTPSRAVSLMVTGVEQNVPEATGITDVTVDSSFTRQELKTKPAGASGHGTGLAYKSKSSATAENPTWTATADLGGIDMIAAMAVFVVSEVSIGKFRPNVLRPSIFSPGFPR